MEAPTPVAGFSPPKTAHPLAGIDQHIAKLRGHVRTSLATLGVTIAGAASASAPGLLVTGSSGAGKTALVRAVAEELADDPSSLTRTYRAEGLLPNEGPDSTLSFSQTQCTWTAQSLQTSVRRL